MSEYQYYEFLALDRPLTAKQRAELRSISSRAEITATRFTNEYQWGDLKGDPLQMVKEYFDAFLYLANWGTRQVMFRLPGGVLDPEIARPYCYADTASLIETDGHLILSLNVDQEEADDYWDEPGGQLAAMVQARSELAAGDLRLLYLAWLLALQSDFVDDEETEPPVPPGLKNLSAGLRAVVDFFEIDENLIAVAAREKAAEQRRRKAEARKAAAEAAAYAMRLDQLATRTEEAWREAAELIETKKPREYDRAVSLLRDLQALAEREGGSAEFRQRFGELRVQHDRKPSLQERFDKAGLPS